MKERPMYIITIDQSAITGPRFPRDAAWWRMWLPGWIADPEDHERLMSDGYIPPTGNNITVNPADHTVTIIAADDRHARRIAEYLQRSSLAKYLPTDAIAIRLVSNSA
jgi:hypothetical protein